jgi:hypothetical protein
MATTAEISYQDLRAAIRAEKERRIREHQANIAKRRRMIAALPAGAHATLNLIAQGDSWFDYPLPLGNPSDVVAHLKHLPSMAPEVLALAHHGEAAEDMLGVTKLHELLAHLKNPANGGFDAILFSGGGNDLAGDQFRLWIAEASAVGMDPAKGLNQPRLDAIMGVVKAGYEDLIAARNDVEKTIPIFAHGYDFAIPNGVGVCGAGPWLKPGLDDRGWTDPGKARAIVRQLLVAFDAMLKVFEADALNNIVYVRTQGTLSDAQWDNELHPTPEGFAPITMRFVDALRTRFRGRI